MSATLSAHKGTSLHVAGLRKEYTANKAVLTHIDLRFSGAGLTAIIGPSGTGKSTLIRCINRLVDPTGGHIWFEHEGEKSDMAALQGADLRRARRHIGMVFQEYNLIERLSVMENLLTGRLGYMSAWRAWLRQFDAADIAEASRLLGVVGLSGFANRRADELSGGQRQRVGIARALMQRPAVLLADEPTSSLDPKSSVEIMTLMRELGRERGIPVIVNMHDVALARRFADRVVGMSGGKVVYDGVPEGLDDDMLRAIYGGEGWLQ